MSEPQPPEQVKLVISSFYADRAKWESCREALIGRFGDTDFQSPEMPFDHTDYYFREMGHPLYRRFASFSRLISPGDLVDIKLYTNELEKKVSEQGSRRVNLDPGWLSLGQFVLATGKPVAHRIYLGRGIYADLTLIYEKGGFRALPWTYPDYASMEIIEMLNLIRKNLKASRRTR